MTYSRDTASAFLAFAEKKVELAILEVGLGGRFDATNVAPASLSVVTSISLDHVEELGSSLVAIAREKAGIFRRGRPAVVLASEEEPVAALRASAEEAGAIPTRSPARPPCPASAPGRSTRFDLDTRSAATRSSRPSPAFIKAGTGPVPSAPRNCWGGVSGADGRGDHEGVAATRWPGRMESFREGDRLVLLDGCHNPMARARSAVRSRPRVWPERRPDLWRHGGQGHRGDRGRALPGRSASRFRGRAGSPRRDDTGAAPAGRCFSLRCRGGGESRRSSRALALLPRRRPYNRGGFAVSGRRGARVALAKGSATRAHEAHVP